MSSELRTAVPASPASRAHTYVRRRARGTIFRAAVLFAFGLGTVAVIIIYRARPHLQTSPQNIRPLPENAQQSAAGYSFTRSEHDHPVFTIRARQSLDLKGGSGTILEGVEVEMFGRNGDQHNLLRTERCEYKPNSGDFFCAGRVEMELDAPPGAAFSQAPDARAKARGRQPVYLETSALAYNQKISVASTAAPVTWRYGDASGSAVGLDYSTREGWLELDHNVAASIPVAAGDDASQEAAQVPLVLAATHLRYTKGSIDLTGPVQVHEGPREVAAGHAIAYLDSQNRITGALLEQGVRASDPSPASSLTAQANTMRAQFEPATGDLKEIQAEGSAAIE